MEKTTAYYDLQEPQHWKALLLLLGSFTHWLHPQASYLPISPSSSWSAPTQGQSWCKDGQGGWQESLPRRRRCSCTLFHTILLSQDLPVRWVGRSLSDNLLLVSLLRPSVCTSPPHCLSDYMFLFQHVHSRALNLEFPRHMFSTFQSVIKPLTTPMTLWRLATISGNYATKRYGRNGYDSCN